MCFNFICNLLRKTPIRKQALAAAIWKMVTGNLGVAVFVCLIPIVGERIEPTNTNTYSRRSNYKLSTFWTVFIFSYLAWTIIINLSGALMLVFTLKAFRKKYIWMLYIFIACQVVNIVVLPVFIIIDIWCILVALGIRKQFNTEQTGQSQVAVAKKAGEILS